MTRNEKAVLDLVAEGCTVPFIARYRKEATGGLDEVQIREIIERHTYQTQLDERRRSVLESIESQGKLTDELRRKIGVCATKAELEDLYLPYKKKRRTRAQIAREKGFEPLADRIMALPASGDPTKEAAALCADPEEALAGARDIVAERVAEVAAARAMVRREMTEEGAVQSRAVRSKISGPTKFEQYYEFSEPVRSIPSHRYLAICRGENEGLLRVSIEVDEEGLVARIQHASGLARSPRSPFAAHLAAAAEDAYRRLIAPSVENDVRSELKERSDAAAVGVFAENLRDLLMAPPLGAEAVIGIDPGIRTGCKCAAVDRSGKLVEHVTIFPATGQGERAAKDLAALAERTRPAAIAVGNGTGGRETEAFVKKVLGDAGLRAIPVVSVNEAGASVYSASDLAREEHPDLDLTIRGAISIARRLRDPLAELVKIDPKAIGVGQYQHDVHQPLLHAKLDEVVESCVNQVGVDLNTASAPLLSRVAGIGPSLAKKIVVHREKKGPFRTRRALLDVSGLGPKAFEQSSGFLRIAGGDHPLDASAVHPERYGVVEKIALDLGVPIAALVGDAELAKKIDVRRYVGEGAGEPTLRDIVRELEKPGRDPRKRFEPPRFRDDVQTVEDLRQGMELEGIVTNITDFGAFVDVGVHQDGLVHVSELADRFVRDPREVVKVGDRLHVRVLDVDLTRRRIALSARKTPRAAPKG